MRRCTWWQSDEQAASFIGLLNSAELRSADEMAQRAMVLAQAYTHRGRWQVGLASCSAGLALEEQLSAGAVALGIAPMLRCLEAQLYMKMDEPVRAEAALVALNKHTHKHVMSQHVAFKQL